MEDLRAALLRNPAVVAVGVGHTAVKVFVRDIGNIPPEIHHLPIEVEEIGSVHAFKAVAPPEARARTLPAQPGCSIGFRNDGFRIAGTFGAVVRRGEQLFILSNNQVLANENGLPKGSAIVQPGPLDGGKPDHAIAWLCEFIRLNRDGNDVDAAIAAVIDPILVDPKILSIGAPTGTTKATLDMIVHKFGRTTSYRVGRVVSIDTDVKVIYGPNLGEIVFNHQIIIRGLDDQPFSAAGDSGSLILQQSDNKVIGLLFAGSSLHTIANPIDRVLQRLNVSLVG